MPTMSLTILGLGTATPPRRIAQTDALELAAGFANAAPGRERTLAAIYRHTRIRTRGSVLLEEPGARPYAQSFFPPAADADDGGPSTADRNRRYREEAGGLAIEAAREAVAAAGVAPGDVTHLVTCSCTGFANPGVDLELVHELGLRDAVARTHVGFMGCHGAFNALRVASAFAAADPAAVVLVVCVELCSLHFQYGAHGDHVVANSIFADGAAAAVGVGPLHDRGRDPTAWRIAVQASRVLPDSRDQMGWVIGDNGFEMSLSSQVPHSIARHIRPLVEGILADRGQTLADVGSWAVHPGGPRVLSSVRESLELEEPALTESAAVLAEHGNMSSATILFILARLFRDAAAAPCVAMAFGPGLTAEVAVLDR
jgi:predicted naringenin-chalcone synthase